MPYASLNARRKLKDARICRGELAEYCCGYAFANIRIVLMNIVHCTNKKAPELLPRLNGWETGFEPATLGTTNRCSNQLSYNHRVLRVQRYEAPQVFRKRTAKNFSPDCYGTWLLPLQTG